MEILGKKKILKSNDPIKFSSIQFKPKIANDPIRFSFPNYIFLKKFVRVF